MKDKSTFPAGVTRRTVMANGLTLIAGCAVTLIPGKPTYATNKTKGVFYGMLGHETNSFSPMISDMEVFENFLIPAGKLDDASQVYLFAPLQVARDKAKEYNWSIFQGLTTFGAPGGPAPKAVYEELRERFLADLKAAMPIDIVALMLHGAMLAECYNNCEGDLLKHIRQLVGKDVVIGTVLDSHTHLGKEMLEYADLLIATKEYPHTDFKERSEELIELLHAASNKEIKPVSSSFDCRMIDNYHTPREPMRSFVNKIKNIEKEDKDILSISVIHSFPWGDSSVMGTKILVISDNNPAKGQQLAEQLGMELFSMRGNLSEPWIPMNDALDQAMATKGGPVVLADAADNPGGGAPCDSTFILQALIDRKITSAVFGRIFDPIALDKVINNKNNELSLKIGGTLSALSGKPVALDVVIKKILRSKDKGVNGEDPTGFDAAWIQGSGIDIVISNSRGQTILTEEFTRLGIPIQQRKLVIVKSSQHFYASFSKIAKKILYVDTPGVLTKDISTLPFKHISRPKWPFDKNPFLEG